MKNCRETSGFSIVQLQHICIVLMVNDDKVLMGGSVMVNGTQK